MTDTPQRPSPATASALHKGRARQDRLKAALKVNMGRRKAQAKARAETVSDRIDDRQQDNE